MKQATYEDDGIYSVCPILEDIDLDAMTDEQLQEELSSWLQQTGGDCPLEYAVEGNIRLVERHIELRGMSDEDLARDLKQAEWAVGYWTEKFAEDNCTSTRNMMAHRERQAEDYRRELARREGPDVAAVGDNATADANDVEYLTTTDVLAALNSHETQEARKSAAWSRPAEDEDFFDPDKLFDELNLLTGENYFPRWLEWRDDVLSGKDQRTKPVPSVPNLYVETFDNFPVKRVFYEDWMGDPESAGDLDDEFLDVGMFGLDAESQYELIAAIAALTPYARDAADRLQPWIDHHASKLAA